MFNENFRSLMPSLFLTLNVEPLAQTWIRRECFYSNGHNDLTSPKRIQSSRARAGLNL